MFALLSPFASLFLTVFASLLLQTATPTAIPTVIADVAEIITETTGTLFDVISAPNLAILGASGFVLALAVRFGPRVVKAMR